LIIKTVIKGRYGIRFLIVGLMTLMTISGVKVEAVLATYILAVDEAALMASINAKVELVALVSDSDCRALVLDIIPVLSPSSGILQLTHCTTTEAGHGQSRGSQKEKDVLGVEDHD